MNVNQTKRNECIYDKQCHCLCECILLIAVQLHTRTHTSTNSHTPKILYPFFCNPNPTHMYGSLMSTLGFCCSLSNGSFQKSSKKLLNTQPSNTAFVEVTWSFWIVFSEFSEHIPKRRYFFVKLLRFQIFILFATKTL